MKKFFASRVDSERIPIIFKIFFTYFFIIQTKIDVLFQFPNFIFLRILFELSGVGGPVMHK